MKKIFLNIAAIVLSVAMISGCAEHEYYHENHHHSPDYDHRHHHDAVGVGVDIHN
jgi:hypothetical protein